MKPDDGALSLDHLTVIDATPEKLVEVAAAHDFRAVCLFLEPMAALARMSVFDLYDSPAAKRDLRRMLEQSRVGLDVSYPFTLSRHSRLENFKLGLDCAAYLGTRFVNVLIYDRDPERRLQEFASFCTLADAFGIDVVLEFFPNSSVRTLADGLDIVRAIGRPHKVGLNVDLLHLMRSGGTVQELASAPPEYILYGQLCDGLADCDIAARDYEASMQRLLPGQGEFDVQAFRDALPPHCPVSLEIPQETAIVAGVSADERARMALAAARATLAKQTARPDPARPSSHH